MIQNNLSMYYMIWYWILPPTDKNTFIGLLKLYLMIVLNENSVFENDILSLYLLVICW